MTYVDAGFRGLGILVPLRRGSPVTPPALERAFKVASAAPMSRPVRQAVRDQHIDQPNPIRLPR